MRLLVDECGATLPRVGTGSNVELRRVAATSLAETAKGSGVLAEIATGDALSTTGASQRVVRGQRLRDVLATPVLAGSKVLAGHAGLDRVVERLNVMEVPDILPWVKSAEFLLTTAYPLHQQLEALPALVGDLDDAGLVGIGIKLGRYLDELPDDVLALADDLGFPIVQLPSDVAFDDVLTDVLTGILQSQSARLERSERIHRALLQIVLEGDGLDRLALDLADLVDAPTAIVATDGRVLASAALPDALRECARLELVPGGVSGDGVIHPATNVAISAGLRLHGHVVSLRSHDSDAATDDRQALEHAATVAALTLAKQQELEAVERRYQSELMHDLLTGRVTRTEDAIARARLYGWDLDRRLITLVAQLDEPPQPAGDEDPLARVPLADTLDRPVHARDDRAAVVRFSDEVVVLTAAFPGEDGRSRAQAFARQLRDAAHAQLGTSVSFGVGRPVDDLHDIPRAYAQATAAVRIGRKLQGPGAASHFDDLGAYRVLDLVNDPNELQAFAREILGELAEDSASSTDLRHTLRVLLDTNGNVAEAARRLHFHYNTLRYRIDKIEGIVGPFTDDAALRLDVHLAILILEMRAV